VVKVAGCGVSWHRRAGLYNGMYCNPVLSAREAGSNRGLGGGVAADARALRLRGNTPVERKPEITFSMVILRAQARWNSAENWYLVITLQGFSQR